MGDTKAKRDDEQSTAEWMGLTPPPERPDFDRWAGYGPPREEVDDTAALSGLAPSTAEKYGLRPHDARSDHAERLGKPPGRDPFTGPYAAWDALDTPSDALLLIRKGGTISAIDRNHVWEITAEGRLAVITCGHTIVTVEGRNLARLPVDFFAGRASFVMEFDPDKGHVMPEAAAPLVTKITSHPQERHRLEQPQSG